VRLPGAGGAPEIAASAREVIMIIRQNPRSFVEKLDFVTSIGYGDGGDARARLGYGGRGPTVVITDLGVLRPDAATRELTLTALHPGVTLDQARAATGWPLKISEELAQVAPPTADELRVLRELHVRTEAARRA
jgi:glutaconate CoA-transferase subunit B